MNAFESHFTRLQSLQGLAGMCAARKVQVVMNHLPISDAKTAELLRVIGEMLDGYAEVGREIRRVTFGYDTGVVMVACRGERRMVALADGSADFERVMRGMEGFLESHLDFAVRRPKRKKKNAPDVEGMPPLATKDRWGRSTISLQGLRATASDLSDEETPAPAPRSAVDQSPGAIPTTNA